MSTTRLQLLHWRRVLLRQTNQLRLDQRVQLYEE
jgi:hypothetical protein